MCFAGFVCELDGRRVTVAECLACSHRRQARGENGCRFTPPIVAGIVEGNRPRELMAYSATELIGCHRRVVLKEREEYWIKPSQAYWAFRGQLGHAIVERYSGNGERAIVEQRFYAQVGGMLVTGKPDLVYPEERLLVDYKTTKSVPKTRKRYTCPECGGVIRENQWRARKGSRLACECGAQYEAGEELEPEVLPPRPYDTHVQQLNVYAWLLAQNELLVERAQVVYLDMSEPFPIPVELWSLAKREAYVERQLRALMERDPQSGLPDCVWEDAEANWRCRYCEVAAACEKARAEETLEEGRRLLRGGDDVAGI